MVRIAKIVLLISISSTCFSQSNWEQLFFDDFQGGYPDNWILEEGWSIFQIDTNYVLAGENHSWANCRIGSQWTDYSFKCRINIRQGFMNINFRVSDRGRYMLGLSKDDVSLTRDNLWGDTYTHLVSTGLTLTEGVWYNIEIIANLKAIQLFIDGDLKVQI